MKEFIYLFFVALMQRVKIKFMNLNGLFICLGIILASLNCAAKGHRSLKDIFALRQDRYHIHGC